MISIVKSQKVENAERLASVRSMPLPEQSSQSKQPEVSQLVVEAVRTEASPHATNAQTSRPFCRGKYCQSP